MCVVWTLFVRLRRHSDIPDCCIYYCSKFHRMNRIGCFEGIEPAKKAAQPEETGYACHERTGRGFQKKEGLKTAIECEIYSALEKITQ